MSRFAELMAMSVSQTRLSDGATQHILNEKKKKDEQRQKAQLEKEKRDREAQALAIKRQAEAEKLAEERKRKAEEEKHRREQLLKQKQEDERRKVLLGPQKKSNWGSSGGGGGGAGKARRSRAGSDDEGMDTGTQILTREEKRMRKFNFDMSKSFTGTRKTGPLAQGSRPSGTISPAARPSAPGPASARLTSGATKALDRMSLKAGPGKRDSKEDSKDSSRKLAGGSSSLARGRSPGLKDRDAMSKASSSKPAEPRTKITTFKPEPRGSSAFSKLGGSSNGRNLSSDGPRRNPVDRTVPKKRSHSYSAFSDEEEDGFIDDDDYDSDSLDGPPTKRRMGGSTSKTNNISSEIWKIFGKDRSTYMANDVYSDDEDDMEADAAALRREELRSERLAKKEDEEALEEEKRHEEAKRRKRKERERTGC